METSTLTRRILSAQSADGGWGYDLNGSKPWTEPTAYALLALWGKKRTGRPIEDGLAWLRKQRRLDGGWAPCAVVEDSTWVTALAVLVESVCGGGVADAKAVEWILRQTGKESWLRIRWKHWLMGARSGPGYEATGWPWYPGAASWITPTALTVIALEAWARQHASPEIRPRVQEAREFLMARRCSDGGWNHGSAKALGVDGESYPETTGAAMCALGGLHVPSIDRAIELAHRWVDSCPSLEGRSWLRLGLLAHHRVAPAANEGDNARGVVEASLSLLADQGMELGRLIWE